MFNLLCREMVVDVGSAFLLQCSLHLHMLCISIDLVLTWNEQLLHENGACEEPSSRRVRNECKRVYVCSEYKRKGQECG